MTITYPEMTTRIRTAAEYLGEHGWAQGTMRAADGSVCLTGAIRYCQPQTGDEYLIREVMRRRGHAETWNDAPGRTASDVTTYLATTPDITDTELAEAFGPQWEQIVALVRRAATLTEQEAIDLAAAWAATRAAAWDAARAAARAAARDAARDAAWAAAVRDLIGQHGFTQAHYDLLAGPWAKVIGPIHPND